MFAGKDDGSDGGAAELQKAHYKTEWHRYNLKRKVAELPPVTAENFKERAAAQKEQQQKAEQDTADTSCRCRACGKSFSSANAHENHLKSKKHREAVATAAAHADASLPADVQFMNARNTEMSNRAGVAGQDAAEKVDGMEKSEAGPSSGKAAGKKSTARVEAEGASGGADECDMESDDGDSVESWTGDALGLEECLFCPHVSASLNKNVKHMTLEHGFFIPDIEYLIDLEGLITHLGEKVGELHMCLWCGEKSRVFTELKGVQQHMVDKGHCKLFIEGDATLEYADFYDYRKSYPDFKEGSGGERMEGDRDEDEDADDAVPQPADLSEASGFQLVLPSGATVGHRTLMKYYRQKLRPDRQLVLSRNTSALNKVISQYKALGWTGTSGAAAQTKAKDIAYVRRFQAQQWTQLGVKGNRLQRHFRDQVFGF